MREVVKSNRYTEARLYAAGGTLVMLLAIWAGLAVKDAVERADAQSDHSTESRISVRDERIVPSTRTRAS